MRVENARGRSRHWRDGRQIFSRIHGPGRNGRERNRHLRWLWLRRECRKSDVQNSRLEFKTAEPEGGRKISDARNRNNRRAVQSSVPCLSGGADQNFGLY